MGELRVLAPGGDTRVIWDPKNKAEVDAARTQFDTLIKNGFAAFSVKKDGDKHKKITKFDSKAGKIIMTPRIAGG